MTYMSDKKKVEIYDSPSYQAYQILHAGFTILPILMGLDKFFYILATWDVYLSAPFNVFGNPHTTMMVVGVIEILVGIGIWLKPKIFSYIIAIWLFAIIVNLLILGGFYDVAVRDFGLLLGALALGRLSCDYECCCCTGKVCDTTKPYEKDEQVRYRDEQPPRV